MKTELAVLIRKCINNLYGEICIEESAFSVDAATKPEHGDYATNVAMQVGKILRKNPKVVAQEIKDALKHQDIADIQIAGPGFINFFIKPEAFQRWLGELLKSDKVLRPDVGQNRKAMVEFVSANPTGPLHIGHGRGAAVGDTLANILEAVGYRVSREYYVNDAGNQMNNLAGSILHRYYEQHGREYPLPPDGYHGDYIADIAAELTKLYAEKLLDMPESDALGICRRAGIKSILGDIRNTLERYNVNIDNYFSESSLYDDGSINNAMKMLVKKNAVYSKDGAVWLRSEKLGDEKDRVLQKSDGSYTYLMPDIAYHMNKYERGYDLLIDVWGADHHGYIKRMSSALELLGFDAKSFEVVLVQMVGLVKGGERIVMSTRAGQFVTLDWLIDEVGVDAARFFYNMRSADSQFEFDLDLAKSRSSDNPVYYIQYAHARVSSLYANAHDKGIKISGNHVDKLTLPEEINLIKKLMDFPSMLATAAKYNEPHRLTHYLTELAGDFHSYYYTTVIVNEEDKEHSLARLSLCKGVASVIKYGLTLLGVSAPERM